MLRCGMMVALMALACGLVGGLGGCARSLWESEFHAEAGTTASLSVNALPKDAPVRVRDVPWERIDRALKAIQTQVEQSDVHPSEWSAEQRAKAQAQLLSGLQVSESPESVTVLGRSMFHTTDRVRPDDGSLAAFARTIGADTVVWSSTYVGKAQVVRDHPVDEYRTVTRSWYDERSKRWRERMTTETTTTWVPVTVEEDRFAWLAYFLRTGR